MRRAAPTRGARRVGSATRVGGATRVGTTPPSANAEPTGATPSPGPPARFGAVAPRGSTSTAAPAETPRVEHRLSAEGADPLILAGVADANLRELTRLFGVRVVLRGDYVRLEGDIGPLADTARVVEHMIELARLGKHFPPTDIARFAASLEARSGPDIRSADERLKLRVPGSRRTITPRSEGQRAYLEAMNESDIVVGIGPAGTGKTYLAVAQAVDALFRKRVRRVILARPAVEAGENLGFLPGDLQEKVDPYLRPLYDALEDMMPAARIRRGIGDRTIEVVPLAYMRGRTLSDAFVILDEAQNATAAQMKMFLTRIGVNSRVVITGDTTQIDLPPSQVSGLIQIEEILGGVDGIAFVYMNESDVTRHRLVKDIIRAYSAADEGRERGHEGREREGRGREPVDRGRERDDRGRERAGRPVRRAAMDEEP